MKQKFQLLIGTLSLLGLLGHAGSASAQTSGDVFRAQATLQGVIQFGPTASNQTLQSVKLNGQDLVNLALGRDRGTKLAPNELLAFQSTLPTNTALLFVYDPVAVTNLATIGVITPNLAILGQSHHRNSSEVSSDMAIPGAGNGTNGLSGGSFVLDSKSLLETNGPIKKLTATGIGFLNVTAPVTNFDLVCVTNIVADTTNIVCSATNTFTVVGTNFTVIVRTATITTQGRKLGSFIVP